MQVRLDQYETSGRAAPGQISLAQPQLQKWFNIFVFFLAFPAITFLGVSITFWIFLIVAYYVRRYYGTIFKLTGVIPYLLLAFPAIAFISLLSAPGDIRSTLLADLKIWLQYVYWIVLSLFLITHGRIINWKESARFIFWGLSLTIFSFYIINATVDLAILTLDFGMPRNAFLFQLLCMVPFALLHARLRYGKLSCYAIALLYLLVALLSGGRAGSILLFAEILICLAVFTKPSWHPYRAVLLPLLFFGLATIAITVTSEDASRYAADRVQPFNSRLAELLRGEDSGDLSEDESWLMRQLMIAKSLEIFQKHPYLGIGISHFTKYDAPLAAVKTRQFRDFRMTSKDRLNSTSAHNSYFQMLAEVGVIGVTNLLLIFIIILVKYLRVLFTRLNMQVLFATSFFIIIIHFYVISSITGAISWFVVGVAAYSLSSKRVLQRGIRS